MRGGEVLRATFRLKEDADLKSQSQSSEGRPGTALGFRSHGLERQRTGDDAIWSIEKSPTVDV